MDMYELRAALSKQGDTFVNNLLPIRESVEFSVRWSLVYTAT